MTLSDVKDAVPLTNRVLGDMHYTQKFGYLLKNTL